MPHGAAGETGIGAPALPDKQAASRVKTVRAHDEHPGAQARMTGQDKEVATNCRFTPSALPAEKSVTRRTTSTVSTSPGKADRLHRVGRATQGSCREMDVNHGVARVFVT